MPISRLYRHALNVTKKEKSKVTLKQYIFFIFWEILLRILGNPSRNLNLRGNFYKYRVFFFEIFHINFYEHTQLSEILHFSLRYFLGSHPVPVLMPPMDSPLLSLLPHNSPPNLHLSCNFHF